MSLVVRRKNFTYDGRELHVETEDKGKLYNHPRADTPALLSHIVSKQPVSCFDALNKVAATDYSSHITRQKDYHVSFYRAQLIHYGLKELKTRDAARKALQRAIEAAQNHHLPIPQDIVLIEQDLKAKWDAAKAAADKKARADELRREQEEREATAKRLVKEVAIFDEVMSMKVKGGKKNVVSK